MAVSNSLNFFDRSQNVPAVARGEKSDGTFESIDASNKALHVTLSGTRLSIVPEVSGSPQSRQRFGDATNALYYLLVTVNAGDAVEAGERLKNGGPDVFVLRSGDDLLLSSSSAITRMDVVAIGDTTSGTLAAGEIVDQADTEAQFRTAMVTFTFDEADDVRTVMLEASPTFTDATPTIAPTTANHVDVFVRGASHA